MIDPALSAALIYNLVYAPPSGSGATAVPESYTLTGYTPALVEGSWTANGIVIDPALLYRARLRQQGLKA